LRDEPVGKTASLVAVILAVSATAAISFQNLGYGLLSAVLLGAAMLRYFVPTRLSLGPDGAQVVHLGRRRKMAWSEVRAVRVLSDGVFLSPFARPSRLESFRGCFLACGANREEVIAFVRTHLPEGTL